MNSNISEPGKEKFYLRAIYIFSAAIFLVILVLSQLPKAESIPAWAQFLPRLNALLNGTCFILLLFSFYFIRQKKIKVHRAINITACILSVIFLLSYVTFHSFGVETKFGDVNHDGVVDTLEKENAGMARSVYFFILSSHIILAAVVLPLVLISLYRGLTNQVGRHKKIVRWSYPVWLYVTLTGVIVYLMISPYYRF